ncbi:MAG: hypothetical protein V3S87_11035, partial [Alphaproteobacteria bacterium]
MALVLAFVVPHGEAPAPGLSGGGEGATLRPHLIAEALAQTTPPLADAGLDQSASVGDTMTLDGSRSTNAAGNTVGFAWTLTSVPPGSAAALNDPAAVKPTFVVDLAGDY